MQLQKLKIFASFQNAAGYLEHGFAVSWRQAELLLLLSGVF